MNLLLDTHAVIWFMTDDPLLPDSVKHAIEDPNNSCLISMASVWEKSIKHSLHKLQLGKHIGEIFQIIELSGLDVLPITKNHVLKLSDLPFHHRDPFDRMLIAQAISENLVIVTKDPWFENYPAKIQWH